MKHLIGIILLCISLFVCILLYLKYDSKGYYYGFGCTFCNAAIPHNLKPEFNFNYPQGFVLFDDDDFEIMGSGFRYNLSSFKIKDVLDYGYNDTSVVVRCTDSTNNVRYLMSYETEYKSKRGNPEVSFKELTSSDFEEARQYYRWIDLDSQVGDEIRLYRTWSFIGSLVSLFFLAKILFRLRKVKTT